MVPDSQTLYKSGTTVLLVKRFLSSYAGVELPDCETTRVLAAGPVERSEAVPRAQAAALRAAHAPSLAARG